MTDQFAAYKSALISLIMLSLLLLVQTILSAYYKIIKDNQAPGVAASGDYKKKAFRISHVPQPYEFG